jgi:hypothetical protein
MNGAGAIDTMHVYHQNMAGRISHISFLDWLPEFFRECSMNLSGVNAAVASGKALELLRQRLVGRHGISDIRVLPGGREVDNPIITIQIETDEPVADRARRLIEYEIHSVNERYSTNIHPIYFSPQRERH